MTYEPVTLESLLQHQDWAMRVARKLVHEESEAEDLLQRTWMAALRRPPRSEGGTRAWIRKVILNLARERHRRRETRERHERASVAPDAPAMTGGSDEPDALERLSRDELNVLLGQQLLAMKEPYRAVLLSRYYEDLSSAEIARRLGIPAGTVRWRLKVGLDLLRGELDKKSNGDRARWVSALAALVPRGAPREADGEDGSEPGSAGPGATGPTGALAAAGWTGLAAVAVLGVVLVLRDGARESGEPEVATAGVAPAAPADLPDRGRAPAGAGAAATSEREHAALEARPAPGPETAAALEVEVVDPGGSPVPGARILVAGAAGIRERSVADGAGRARLGLDETDVGALGLAATRGRVSLRALADGRAASPLVHAARPLERDDPVVLVVGGPEIVRRGRVIDAAGAPIADACVAWIDPYGRLARLPRPDGDFASPGYLATSSEPDGSFALAHLADEPGHLLVSAPGFVASFSKLEPASGPDGGEGATDVVLSRGARVTGTVRHPNGTPAAGVHVGLEPLFKASEWATGLPAYDVTWRGFGEATRTDADGRFALSGVAPGTRFLWAHSAQDGLAADLVVAIADGDDVRQDVVLEPRTGFRLRFVDETGRPLAGWIAHIRRPTSAGNWWIRHRVSDDDGRVHVADAPEAEVFLDVFDPSGAGASWLACKVRPSASEEELTVETRASSTVAGRVVDHAGAPQLDGTLTFHSLRTTQEIRAERADDGEFEVRLAPGLYMLVLQLEASAVKLARVELDPGEHEELGILASPALGTLRVDAPHAAAPGVTPSVALFTAVDPERSGRFQPVGRADVTGERAIPLFPGRYRVLAHDGTTERPREHFVEVRAHAETRLDPWR